MVQRLNIDGEAVISDADDNITINGEVVTTITIDGAAEKVWEKDAGGGNPIVATLLISPSTLNPGGPDIDSGSFTQLLNTVQAGGHPISSMEKQIEVSMHNISGGDGGPYTVDYSGLGFAGTLIEECPGERFYGETPDVIRTYAGATGDSSSPIRTGAAANADTLAGGLTHVAGKLDYSNDPGLNPLTQRGQSRLLVTGSVTITDSSGGSAVFAVPQGNNGTFAGTGNTYQDAFDWGDTQCIIF